MVFILTSHHVHHWGFRSWQRKPRWQPRTSRALALPTKRPVVSSPTIQVYTVLKTFDNLKVENSTSLKLLFWNHQFDLEPIMVSCQLCFGGNGERLARHLRQVDQDQQRVWVTGSSKQTIETHAISSMRTRSEYQKCAIITKDHPWYLPDGGLWHSGSFPAGQRWLLEGSGAQTHDVRK